jgi:hypothetical protein
MNLVINSEPINRRVAFLNFHFVFFLLWLEAAPAAGANHFCFVKLGELKKRGRFLSLLT